MRYGTRRVLGGAVMVAVALTMRFHHGPIIRIHGLTPTHVSAHGLYHGIAVVGFVLWLTGGAALMVNGLLLRRRDPDWQPDRR